MIGTCYRYGWVVSGACGPWVILLNVESLETCVVRADELPRPCPCGNAERHLRTRRLT